MQQHQTYTIIDIRVMDTDAKTYIYRSLDNVMEMQEKEKRYEISPHMSSLKEKFKTLCNISRQNLRPQDANDRIILTPSHQMGVSTLTGAQLCPI